MKLRMVGVLSIMTLLLAVVFVVPARGQPAAQMAGGLTPVLHTPEMSPEETYTYWTAERMAGAQVDSASQMAPAGQSGPVDPSLAIASGPAVAANGCPPGKFCPEQTLTAAQAGIEPSVYVGQYYPKPWPYNYAYMVGAWSQFYPMRTNAKLFYTRGGVNYVGSATVLTDNGAGVNRLVTTNGGSVGYNGTWDSSGLVCPAYSSGQGPWGCWAIAAFYAYNNWVNSSDYRWDYGFIVTAKTSNTGYGRIGTVIGSQGWIHSASYIQMFWQYGYPDASPFNGLYLVWNTAGTAVIDNVNNLGTPYELGTGTAMNCCGNFGGGWIINQRIAAPGWLNGENAYWYSVNGETYSSYHDAAWIALYNNIRAYNP